MRIIACLIAPMLVAPVSAATLIYKDLDDLVNEADGILIGTVSDIVVNSHGNDIYTYVTLGNLDIIWSFAFCLLPGHA